MNFVYIIRKKVLINLRIAFSNNCVQVEWGGGGCRQTILRMNEVTIQDVQERKTIEDNR